MADTRAEKAAANNADLYEEMYRAHFSAFEKRDDAFIGLEKPPPYYSNLTVLRPHRSAQILAYLRQIGERCGGSVGFKDSFFEYDLREQGFDILFEAAWLWSSPRSTALPEGWSRIDSPSALQRWEETWKTSGSPTIAKMFPQALMARPNIAFFAKFEGPSVTAGCIGNRSADCVGVSNIFNLHGTSEIVGEATAAVAAWVPHLPLTGYATGLVLNAAMQNGFEAVGKLRVQLAVSPTF
jgi:hypothetical protein